MIPEARFLKFMDTRKQVYAVYERYEAELRELQKKADSSTDKLTLSELWSAGGSLAEMAGAIRLAQMKALAAAGMSESEYRDIQLAVYKSAWASEAESESGKLPAEAVSEAALQVPRANVELFRKHQAEHQEVRDARARLPGIGDIGLLDERERGPGARSTGRTWYRPSRCLSPIC